VRAKTSGVAEDFLRQGKGSSFIEKVPVLNGGPAGECRNPAFGQVFFSVFKI
jgi:hypothetical protein